PVPGRDRDVRAGPPRSQRNKPEENQVTDWLEKTIDLRSQGTTARIETLAGITTFLTMAYIIVVNPLVLGDAGVPVDGALFATVMVAGLSSILMGLMANLPIAVAPGMGLNAFFSYTL